MNISEMTEVFKINFTAVQFGDMLLRLLVACLCGAAIGFERTRRLKEAGLRTHLIVCAASALMMIVSKYGFGDLVLPSGEFILGTHGADPSRIAAQVISGVSFIGAGVIFHNDNSVTGLTTAAGLWATSGIGLALGAGLYGLGIFSAGIITVVQLLLHKYMRNMDDVETVRLVLTVNNTPEFRRTLQEYLTKSRAELLENRYEITSDGQAEYDLTLRMTHQITIDELNGFFEDFEDVKKIACTSVK